MSATLFKRSLRSAAAVMAAIVVVLAFYIAMVAYLYDPEVSESIQLMQAAMPELFEAFGMANPSATLLDFLLNYLYGFLFTGTLVLMAAYLAQRLVVGPVRGCPSRSPSWRWKWRRWPLSWACRGARK